MDRYQEGISALIWNILGLQQRDRQNSARKNIITFYRPIVTNAQCIIGTEKYPDADILWNYNDDDHFQGYGKTKHVFRAPRNSDIIQPYKTDPDFRSPIDGKVNGYILIVSVIRYEKTFSVVQPIKVEFKLDGMVPVDKNGNDLVLTNKLISITSGGQRIFALMWTQGFHKNTIFFHC